MQRVILDTGTIGSDSAEANLRQLQIKLDILAAEVDRLSRLMHSGPSRLLSVATGS